MRIKWFSLVRICGLLMILGYHFVKGSYPGGFIGVDLFFVFSGFLITSLMLDEFAQKQHFDLLAFYRRRLYRIFPPLVLMVLVTIAFTYLANRDLTTNLGRQAAAALGVTTNYFEMFTGGSYENQFIPHLFVHTWFLAVEVQLYLVWGALVYLFSRLFRASISDEKSGKIAATNLRALLFFTSMLLAGGSVVAMLVNSWQAKDFSNVYFNTLTHAFPFFIGSTLGTLTGVQTIPKKFQQALTRWTLPKILILLLVPLGCLLVLGRVLSFTNPWTYPLGLLLASVLTALMIYAARVLHEKTPTVAEPKIVTYLASISYGVYLFHWPLYVIFASHFNYAHNGLAVIFTVLLSVVLASFSYYIVEPLLAGKNVQLPHYTLTFHWGKWGLLALALPLSVVAGFTIAKAPSMSSLEQNLWVASLYQDVDEMNTTYELANNQQATDFVVPAGVSIIGDSVTLGTRQYLSAHVADSTVDAAGNRKMNEAYDVMMDQQNKKILREYVVICVGTNAIGDWQEWTQKVIDDLAPGHRLIFMTPHQGGAGPKSYATQLMNFERTLPDKYDFITLADWYTVATEHPEIWVDTDGTHFAGNDQGDQLFAQCINDALTAAAAKPAKSNVAPTTK